jgi:hypothetical protein
LTGYSLVQAARSGWVGVAQWGANLVGGMMVMSAFGFTEGPTGEPAGETVSGKGAAPGSQGGARATYDAANTAGVTEVGKARNEIGYRPEQHGWKLLHAGRAYHWTLKATEFLFGTSSGPVGYLGRLLVTPFVTAGGALYELHAAFNPFFNGQFPLDRQNPLNLLFDTAGDLVANTYGQAVALTPGLSAGSASSALQAVRYIPGPHSEAGFLRTARPALGY